MNCLQTKDVLAVGHLRNYLKYSKCFFGFIAFCLFLLGAVSGLANDRSNNTLLNPSQENINSSVDSSLQLHLQAARWVQMEFPTESVYFDSQNEEEFKFTLSVGQSDIHRWQGVRIGSAAPGNHIQADNAAQYIRVFWPGGLPGILSDSENEIISHADGDRIDSGELLTLNSHLLISASRWAMEIDFTNTVGELHVQYLSTLISTSDRAGIRTFAFKPNTTGASEVGLSTGTITDLDNSLDSDVDNVPETNIADAEPSDGEEEVTDADVSGANAGGVTTTGAVPNDMDEANADLEVALTGPDTDNDGIPDSIEGTADVDGDGLPNRLDPDSDNDSIPDAIESFKDTDADNIPDYLDTDSDNDTIPDSVESPVTTVDSDNDNIVDFYDVDSTQGDDHDLDGVDDKLNRESLPDTDNDALPDHLDTDSDNDGLPDSFEVGDNPNKPNDSDEDGVADFLVTDSDGDAIPDIVELDNLPSDLLDTEVIPESLDPNSDNDNDSIPNLLEGAGDTDSDGVPNYLDSDSDGDGIGDDIESIGQPGFPADTDRDGIPDYIDHDADNDGIADANEGHLDFDSDGVPDYRDLDTDNDGIFDLLECLSGSVHDHYLDANQDGMIDQRFSVGENGFADELETAPDSGLELNPVADSDSDGVFDFRDQDSDNDAIPDSIESGHTDTDYDGFIDGHDPLVNTDFSNTTEIVMPPTGGLVEGSGASPINTDGDERPDYRDRDSDNDGIPDVIESVDASLDIDHDGFVDNFTDSDANGVDDSVQVQPHKPVDTDNDGFIDSVDVDSDADGIGDLFEAGGSFFNSEGVVNNFVDTDVDGVDDAIALVPLEITDSDSDGIPDFKDRDSDNDGLSDLVETSGVDWDGDEQADALTPLSGIDDRNDNGVPDYQEAFNDIISELDATSGSATSGSATSGSATSGSATSGGATSGSATSGGATSGSATSGSATSGGATSGGATSGGATSGGATSGGATSGGATSGGATSGSTSSSGAVTAGETGVNELGIPATAQRDGTAYTGVRGSGCSISGKADPSLLFMMMLASIILLVRYLNAGRVLLFTFVSSLLFSCSNHTKQDLTVNAEPTPDLVIEKWESVTPTRLKRSFYATAGFGLSSLEPDTSELLVRDVDDAPSPAVQLSFGVDVSKHLATELHAATLGRAELTPSGNIGYEQLGASVLFYAGKSRHRYRREGFTVFGRLGVGVFINDSSPGVPQTSRHASHTLFGLGGELMFRNGFGFRSEIISFDEDAQIAQLGLIYRMGRSEKRRIPMLAKAVPVPDTDDDGVIDTLDDCDSTKPNLSVNRTGCAHFDGVVEGVEFDFDSANLTLNAQRTLDTVVQTLLEYPEANLKIAAHTDSIASDQYNIQLSVRRARSVAKYLVSGGVTVQRLSAAGYGETRPIDSNETIQGRQRNRRVELQSVLY